MQFDLGAVLLWLQTHAGQEGFLKFYAVLSTVIIGAAFYFRRPMPPAENTWRDEIELAAYVVIAGLVIWTARLVFR